MRFAFLSLFFVLWAASAHAGTVAILRPRSTAEMTEALSHLHGELLSVGLEVRVIDGPLTPAGSRADAQAWLDTVAADTNIDAIIDIVGGSTPVAVDVWVIEKSPRRLGVSRVELEPDASNASEQLAIRAVEFLRSTFLENDMTARARRDEPRAAPPRATLASHPPNHADALNDPSVRVSHSEHSLGVEAGAMALTSLSRVGTQILPMLRFNWAAHRSLIMNAMFAGLGSRPTLTTPLGNARIAQQFGTVGGIYRWRPEHRWWPFAGLAGGVLHTLVEGHAVSPRLGHSVDQWSFLAELRFGVGLQISDRYYSTLGMHVQAAAPHVAIHFVDEVVATTGRLSLALTFTLGVWP